MENNCGSPSDPEHQRLVREKIAKENEQEALATNDSRLIIRDLLNSLGYRPDEIKVDASYDIATDTHQASCMVDYLISIEGRKFMAIKCSMAMESRERHVVSFARVVDKHMIPFAVITDGLEAYMMDTLTAKTLSTELNKIPSRDYAVKYLEANPPSPFPQDKLERAKRVLLAFETTICPTTKSE